MAKVGLRWYSVFYIVLCLFGMSDRIGLFELAEKYCQHSADAGHSCGAGNSSRRGDFAVTANAMEPKFRANDDRWVGLIGRTSTYY